MIQFLQQGHIPAARSQGRLCLPWQLSYLPLLGLVLVLFTSSVRSTSASGWIMAGAPSPSPVCPAHCLVVNDTLRPGTYRGQTVGFTACDTDTNAQIWSYDNASHTISVFEPSSSTPVCLEAVSSNQPVSGLVLAACVSPAPRGQLWRIDTASASVLSRSFYPEKILAKEMDFTYVNNQTHFSWRKAVLVGNGTYGDNQTRQIVMSLVPAVPSLSLSSAPATQIVGNLVANGGFELCSYDVNERGPSVTINSDDIFGPCFWTIDSGQVQILGPGKRIAEGLLFVGLYGQSLSGTISQALNTVPRVSYLLSYLMAADTTCGDDVKRMQVDVKPSIGTMAGVAIFNTSGLNAQTIRWSQKLINFQATQNVTTISFQSLENAGCGPYIDDVRVAQLDGPLPPGPTSPSPPERNQAPASPTHQSRSGTASTGAVLGAAAAAFVAGSCVIIFIYVAWRTIVKTAKQSIGHVLSFNFSSRGLRVGASSSLDDASYRRTIAESPSPALVDPSNPRLEYEIPKIPKIPKRALPRQFSYDEIDHASRSFSTLLGRGRLGFTYAAQLEDGTNAAIKREYSNARSSNEDFMRDVEVLWSTRHPNLVTFLGYCKDQGEHIIVYEHMKGGSLHDHLHGLSKTPLSWNKRLKITREVAAGLEYLHHRAAHCPVLHRNVSSNNVLLTETLVAKLMDFGLSRREKSAKQPAAHSPKYRPSSGGYLDPSQESAHSTKSDVYSFGVIILELLTGREAIHVVHWARDYLSSKDRLHQFLDPMIGSAVQSELDVLTEIVNMCIQHSAEDRPSMQTVCELLRMHIRTTESDDSSEIRPVSPSRQSSQRNSFPKSPAHQK